MSERDLIDYAKQYRALPFEAIQASYRRQMVLRELKKFSPKRVLEVGCGLKPLFTDLSDDIQVTVIDPVEGFFRNAQDLAVGKPHVSVFQAFVEEFVPPSHGFDFIVLSCVLHEVLDPARMLQAVHGLCVAGTVVHVNVPNATSLHRMLAVSMGLMDSPVEPSKVQRQMQQRLSVYDAAGLAQALIDASFDVIDKGSLFVKPFTHAQMQHLVDTGFMTSQLLDGLDRLVEWLPEFGSEIWVNAMRSRQ